MGMITAYLVKYRIVSDAVESSNQRVRRNSNDLATVVEANGTSLVIDDLDPRNSYAVSVAVRTRAGVGSYSPETVVGCKSTFNHMLILFCSSNCFIKPQSALSIT